MSSINLPPLFISVFIISLFSSLHFSAALAIGVNWGTAASHPLPPAQVVQLLKANNVNKVKLFDTDPVVLQALSGSSIYVTVGISNSMLRSLNSSLKAAVSWVHDNLTRFVSDGSGGVRIEFIAVGDDSFLQSYGEQFYPFVVGAAANIQTALTKFNLADRVKVVIPCSFDAFQSESGLPSKGKFRPDVNKTMSEVLTFLSKHGSPLFVTISPFMSYHQNKNVSLDFALLQETARPRNDSYRSYRNSFDLSYDTLVTALSTAGFPHMDIVIGQIGWPTDGAANATPSIAQAFLKGLMDHLDKISGTPLRPRDPPLETYIFSLLDEDQRSTAAGNFERHWGIFTFDGQAKYQIDFVHGSGKLVNAQNVQYLSSRWCVVNNNKDLSNISAQVVEACSAGDCSTLLPGGSCSNLSWPGNISYAFNSYYQQHDQRADSCAFGGLGLITTVDPSVENCRFVIGLRDSLSSSLCRSSLLHWIISPVVTILFCLLRVTW
ncbi:hypothetical protein ACH5RR_010250 [Cinchona calisaya]|uniref:glucan endo-1,3-beta-D-glucosidase n=1 Tax=Cinchona calisaya TaxID=153742 RepID=A0ABD3AIL0_9GENT